MVSPIFLTVAGRAGMQLEDTSQTVGRLADLLARDAITFADSIEEICRLADDLYELAGELTDIVGRAILRSIEEQERREALYILAEQREAA